VSTTADQRHLWAIATSPHGIYVLLLASSTPMVTEALETAISDEPQQQSQPNSKTHEQANSCARTLAERSAAVEGESDHRGQRAEKTQADNEWKKVSKPVSGEVLDARTNEIFAPTVHIAMMPRSEG
jgi:hypothetical protein